MSSLAERKKFARMLLQQLMVQSHDDEPRYAALAIIGSYIQELEELAVEDCRYGE